MRTLILLCLLAAGVAAKGQNLSEGTWIPVSEEIGGKALPAAAFTSQKLIIKDTTYTVIAESVDKGTVKVSGNHLDIYGTDGVNKGKHFTAIFKLDAANMAICYNLAGTDYPADFDTKGHPLFFLSVFRRE